MKALHRPELFSWSVFDERLNLDFNGYAWVRAGGNVLVDPVAMSEHDRAHLASLGGAAWIVVTNSDHVRATREVAAHFGAQVAGPRGEREGLPISCDRWLGSDDELVPGLRVLELDGSKTPGELALVLDETTLVTGDLVRCHTAGSLTMLPAKKLRDRAAAVASIRALLDLQPIEAVLVGDGWPVFRDGRLRIAELVASLQ